MQFECKECNESFQSQRSLHAHLKKHEMLLGDYYVKHYPRQDKLTGDPIQFKGVDQYFSSDFNSNDNMKEWCDTAPPNIVKEFILEKFKRRIEDKKIKKAPSTIYLATAGLPTMDTIKKLFGSYSSFCYSINLEPAYGNNLDSGFFDDFSGASIYVDTRENQPLYFKNAKSMKLDFGDYTLTPKNYTYTHVERKSFSDFAATITNGYSRFLRELERCRTAGCYMFIVVECDFNSITKINNSVYKRFNMNYVFHQMREVESGYNDCCQFVFSGSREYSQELIPKILCLGKKLWKVDIQYFWNKYLEKYGVDHRKSETEQEVQKYKRRNFGQRRLFGRRRG